MKISRIYFTGSQRATEVWGDQLSSVFQLVKDRITARCPATFEENNAQLKILVDVDDSVGAQGFRIADQEENTVLLVSDSIIGITAGFGKLLRTSDYSPEGMRVSSWRGTSVPSCPLRGIQMDSHFCNFYHMAPAEELQRYVQDLALWGINCIDVVYPLIDFCGWDDPEAEHVLQQIKVIYDTAKSIGIQVGMEVVPNQDFVTFRPEFKATPHVEEVARRGNNGNNMCPNIPGAMEYIVETYGYALRYLKERGVAMDFLCFWPYDEGGCSCEKCRPWGANGFLKASKAICEKVKEDLPNITVILSTWLFDTPDDQGEWSGLSAALDKENGWIDYILADSHTDFPEYPLTHDIPGGLPLLNYPEISMWALFPWGGYGANPLPERFQSLWHQAKAKVSGGIAYSEGIFDDINKITVSFFYWNKEGSVEEALEEYIRYEYAPEVYEKVREAIRIIEANHVGTAVGKNRNTSADCNTQAVNQAVCDSAKRALTLLEQADELLPQRAQKSWRWRILYLRAKLDVLRFERSYQLSGQLRPGASWTEVLRGCEEAKVAMQELVQIYHSNMHADDKMHPMFRCVRPALKEL